MNTKITAVYLAAALTATVSQSATAQEKLLFFYPSPPSPANEKMFTDWANKVQADSKGALAMEFRANSPLANFGNIMDRVDNDVVQMGVMLTTIYAGKFELTNVASVPFTIALDGEDHASAAAWRVYKDGLLASEYQTIVPLFMGVSKQSGFHFAKAPPSLDKLDGLKIRIFSNSQLPMIRALGMQPASLAPTEIYQAIQRGTIDGTITSWTTFPSTKLQEVTKYHAELPLGGSILQAFMSRKKLESLPASGRAAIEANANEQWTRAYARVLNEDAENGKKGSSGPDHTIVQLTLAQTADWKKRFGDEMIEAWKKANGDQGEKVMAAFAKHYADARAGR